MVAYLKVEPRANQRTGISHGSYNFACLNSISCVLKKLLKLCRKGVIMPSMIDDNNVAVSLKPVRIDYLSFTDSMHWATEVGLDIHSASESFDIITTFIDTRSKETHKFAR